MSKPARIFLFAVVATVMLLFSPDRFFSQSPPPGSQETVLTFIHDFLQIYYPEVVSKGNQLVLCVSHPADASWREISGVYFKVAPFSAAEPDPLVAPNESASLLGGSFWLTPQRQYGRIFQVHASAVLYEKQINAVRGLIESHPEWSDAEAIQALKAAGARYGPREKEEFVSSLHLERAERFLGKLTIKSVEFRGPSADHTGQFAAGTLDWVVQTEAEFSDGTHCEYGFTFEPFAGKLMSLSRR